MNLFKKRISHLLNKARDHKLIKEQYNAERSSVTL